MFARYDNQNAAYAAFRKNGMRQTRREARFACAGRSYD
jgi:hypothetical protein